MPGGILKILATGNQNVFLTGNPKKTFFKAVYAKYTNFGLQKFRIDFNGLRTLRMSEDSLFTFKSLFNLSNFFEASTIISSPEILLIAFDQ